MDQIPIAGAALRVLLILRRIIDRELDIAELRQLLVAQDRDRIAVGRHGQLERLAREIGDDGVELGMQPVLARAEIDGAHRQAFDHRAYVGKTEPVDPPRIPVAEAAGQIAVVGQPETQRELYVLRLGGRACRDGRRHVRGAPGLHDPCGD